MNSTEIPILKKPKSSRNTKPKVSKFRIKLEKLIELNNNKNDITMKTYNAKKQHIQEQHTILSDQLCNLETATKEGQKQQKQIMRNIAKQDKQLEKLENAPSTLKKLTIVDKRLKSVQKLIMQKVAKYLQKRLTKSIRKPFTEVNIVTQLPKNNVQMKMSPFFE